MLFLKLITELQYTKLIVFHIIPSMIFEKKHIILSMIFTKYDYILLGEFADVYAFGRVLTYKMKDEVCLFMENPCKDEIGLIREISSVSNIIV